MNKLRKILLLTFWVISTNYAYQLKSDLILSISINNYDSDTLLVLDNYSNKVYSLLLSKKKNFNDTIPFEEGYYYLNVKQSKIKIYLKPNFNLKISLNAQDPYKSIIYKGVGAAENKYLLKKYLLEEDLGKLEDYIYYNKLNENRFLELMDSIYTLKNKLLQDQPKLDKDFIFIESRDIEYEKIYKIADYEVLHGFMTNNFNFKVSSDFPDVISNIDLSNDKLLKSLNYHVVVEKYLLNRVSKKIKKNPSLDLLLTLLETVDENITNKKIKEEFAYYFFNNFLKKTKKIDEAFNEFNTLVTNKNYKNEIKKKYSIYKKISFGAISPSFEFPDIHNNLVSLESLKGHYVYIDIWATWCLPCIKAMPNFESLKKEFKNKNIKFVSICKDDTKERWMKMVKEKKLTDIQLFVPNSDLPFFKNYLVESVPRYILIDKEGKIIDAYAKSPSHPKLKRILKSLR